MPFVIKRREEEGEGEERELKKKEEEFNEMKKKEIERLAKWEEDLSKRERTLQLRSQGKTQVSGEYKK